jgi:hypothetical protein
LTQHKFNLTLPRLNMWRKMTGFTVLNSIVSLGSATQHLKHVLVWILFIYKTFTFWFHDILTVYHCWIIICTHIFTNSGSSKYIWSFHSNCVKWSSLWQSAMWKCSIQHFQAVFMLSSLGSYDQCCVSPLFIYTSWYAMTWFC